LKIISDNGLDILNTKITSIIGLNTFDYDLAISKEVADKWNKKDTKIQIKEADNKKFYIPFGKYSVILKSTKSEVKQVLEISESK
jgi:hypothetical protein